MSKPTIPIVIILLAFQLAGCAAGTSPVFRVDSFDLVQRSDNAALLHVTLLGTNQSDTPMQLRTITYTMAIDGLPQTTISRQAQSTLPANSQLALTLPVVLSDDAVRSMLDKEIAYQFRAKVSYLRPGKFAEVLYDLGIKRASNTFSDQGVITIPSQKSLDAGS